MGKHTDKLKPLDEFRAPWETEGGTDAEIDKPKLRRWIHGILTDKAKAQDARDDEQAAREVAETERDDFKQQAASANGDEAQKKIDRLEAENTKLKQEAADRKAADEHEELRKEVVGDLDPKYAKYVVGADREALEKSLEAVKADFGISEESGEEDEDEEPQVRTTPRSRLKNPADAKSGNQDPAEYDFDKIADDIVGVGPFG